MNHMTRSKFFQPLTAVLAAFSMVGTLLVLVTLGASGSVSAASVQSTGWAWASKPTTESYNAVSSYSYNSEGQTNRIERRAEGQYTVIFKGLHRDDFEARVVAYGDGSIFCDLDGNNNNGTSVFGSDLHVHVRCLDNIDLEPTDSRFVASMTGQDGSSRTVSSRADSHDSASVRAR